MKALVHFFSTIFLSSAIWAQSQPEMRYGQGDFMPLENAVVLTTPAGSGEFWDDICYEVELNAPVFFNAYSLVLSKMKICSDGQITLSNAANTQNYILMPFRAEFIDKRVDESLLETSDILYETRDGFTTIEFRNVASRVEFGWYGSVNSTFTFQARIEHSTGNVRYWYGESDYQSALWDIVINTNEISEAGLRIKPIVVAETAWFFTGTPDNVDVSQVPNFDGNNYPANRLREIPVNGSIIEFVWEPSTSIFNENNKMEAKLFPNPSSSGFSLLFEGEQANVFITNAQGQIIWEKHNVASGEYCAPALLQPGLYLVRILSDNRAKTLTWIKR